MDINTILMNHYKKVLKQDSAYFKVVIDPENIKNWYVLVSGLDNPYKDGVYIYRLVLKNSFPDEPPCLRALTPNGVFIADNMPICTSIGIFHQNMFDKSGSYGYRTALGIYGFIMNAIINAMVTAEVGNHGIRFVVLPLVERKRLASLSKKYNEDTYPDILKMFVN